MKFKDYYKLSESEFDFGDDAQAASVANVAADVNPKYSKLPNVNEKNKAKFREARGFIKTDGRIERIDTMPHETFAMDIGVPIMKDGKLINKKFANSKFLCIETSWVRWSPESFALSVYQPMSPEQIKTIKEIIKSFGYMGIDIEYMNKEGKLNLVSFNEGDPSLFNAKISGIQHKVSDKKLGQH